VREAALAEARLLQGLRHPHIVACEEAFYDGDYEVVRLVLEYMDGGDVQRHLVARREAKEAFPLAFAYRILSDIGDALSFIHLHGVLHRDVKPANLLLTAGARQIKLADFGIAKLVEVATLKAHSMVGTPYYLSPELVAGQAYGPAADAWALGACLYEVLALRRPFEAGNHLALMRLICDEQPPTLGAHAPEELRSVVDGFLAKDPRERLPLLEAIQRCATAAAREAVTSGLAADAANGELQPPLLAEPEALTAAAGVTSQRPAATTTTGPHAANTPSSETGPQGTTQCTAACGGTLDTEAVLRRASFSDSESPDAAATLEIPLPFVQEGSSGTLPSGDFSSSRQGIAPTPGAASQAGPQTAPAAGGEAATPALAGGPLLRGLLSRPGSASSEWRQNVPSLRGLGLRRFGSWSAAPVPEEAPLVEVEVGDRI